MTVIEFRRPRSARGGEVAGTRSPVSGTFQSPRGRSGRMSGVLRVVRLHLGADGPHLDGVFTAELREPDGSLIGIDSRRATVAVAAVARGPGLRLVVAPLELDLMGITVRVHRFTIDPSPAPLGTFRRRGAPRSGRTASDEEESS